MLTEDELCSICRASGRDTEQLCVVESPADVMAVEEATGYRGLYFVLMGHLSPLDGIGPSELGLDALEQRLEAGEIRELIIATNPTVEGDATAHYLGDIASRHGVGASRIAHGVPLGGELEYVDGGTLSHAFYGRRAVNEGAK
jgi:recombination protein RecR